MHRSAELMASYTWTVRYTPRNRLQFAYSDVERGYTNETKIEVNRSTDSKSYSQSIGIA